jgi:hypothetical protein
MIRIVAILLALLALGIPVQAGTEPEKLDRLMVFGDSFLFGVKEPAGWQGDTEEGATRFHVNITFYRADETLDRATTLIRVKVNDKADENTAEDLAFDMKGYQEKYPKVQFEDLEVSHPSYRVFAKVFSVPGEFHEYVVYLNPGPETPYIFSVAMSPNQRAASDDELGAFREIVESLTAIPVKGQ